MHVTPAFEAAASTSAASAAFIAIGFSIITRLPARIAASEQRASSSWGVAISTASIEVLYSSSKDSIEAWMLTPPVARAARSAAVASGSAHATNWRDPERATASARLAPSLPQPTTPTRSCCLFVTNSALLIRVGRLERLQESPRVPVPITVSLVGHRSVLQLADDAIEQSVDP